MFLKRPGVSIKRMFFLSKTKEWAEEDISSVSRRKLQAGTEEAMPMNGVSTIHFLMPGVLRLGHMRQ